MTVQTSGTQAAVVSTEHTLATVTVDKTLMLSVDLSNLALGDKVELTVKTKVLTGSTSGIAYKGAYQHVQGKPVVFSIPIPSAFESIFLLQQTAGTARNFDWSVYSL